MQIPQHQQSFDMWMNVSGTLNVFRLLRDPTLCLPQHTVSTFNHLPIPLSKAFPRKIGKDGEKEVDIQAVVLDKDNCFAIPHTDEVHKPYKVGQVLLLFPHCTLHGRFKNTSNPDVTSSPYFLILISFDCRIISSVFARHILVQSYLSCPIQQARTRIRSSSKQQC